MMKPKEVHLQFDENGRVTHVHTGPGAPETFGPYVLASSPLKSSYDCRCMPITPEAADFVRLLRDMEPVCPACGTHHGVGVDGLPDDTCGDPPVVVGAPLFRNGTGTSTVPANSDDRPIGIAVADRPESEPIRFMIKRVSKTCSPPTIIRDAAGVVVHHEDHPEHAVYEFEVEATRGDKRASVRLHLGADAGGRLTQAIGAAGAMVRKASSRNARLVRDE